tara:strand:+ start:1066 stop:1293 length:228 start_codon:yes stop_codon:yes gene_type:complete
MKISKILFLTLAIMALNPRVDFEGTKRLPKYIISCSTGWSLQWRKGLIGIYSLESALQINRKHLKTRASIMSPCL